MIETFRGDNFCLSNTIRLDGWIETEQGLSVPTAEHAYQANKFTNKDAHRSVAAAFAKITPAKPYAWGIASKERALELVNQGFAIRADWDEIKLDVMYEVVWQKFGHNPRFAKWLVATGSQKLVEGNNWGDRFWGVDPIGSTNGENHLGEILMVIRNKL